MKKRRGPGTYLSDIEWGKYAQHIYSFLETTAGLQEVTWLKTVNPINSYGEDQGAKHIDLILTGLIAYNYFRSWPLNQPSRTGEVDKENCVLLLSKDYLEKAGYLDDNGYFIFDSANDRFILEGKLYKASGDTGMSQAKDKPLVLMIILQREENSNHNIIT